MSNPLSATYNLQQTTTSNFPTFSKIINKADDLSSAAVVIGALRDNIACYLCKIKFLEAC